MGTCGLIFVFVHNPNTKVYIMIAKYLVLPSHRLKDIFSASSNKPFNFYTCVLIDLKSKYSLLH